MLELFFFVSRLPPSPVHEKEKRHFPDPQGGGPGEDLHNISIRVLLKYLATANIGKLHRLAYSSFRQTDAPQTVKIFKIFEIFGKYVEQKNIGEISQD